VIQNILDIFKFAGPDEMDGWMDEGKLKPGHF
jgi:hypothetical protein